MPVTPEDAGRVLTSREALNALALGIARSRFTDIYLNDIKGTSLALSTTNASKAIPANCLGASLWCASDFRWRINTAADLTDGAYARGYEVTSVLFDPDALPQTVQAILPSGSATLYINWLFGS